MNVSASSTKAETGSAPIWVKEQGVTVKTCIKLQVKGLMKLDFSDVILFIYQDLLQQWAYLGSKLEQHPPPPPSIIMIVLCTLQSGSKNKGHSQNLY